MLARAPSSSDKKSKPGLFNLFLMPDKVKQSFDKCSTRQRAFRSHTPHQHTTSAIRAMPLAELIRTTSDHLSSCCSAYCAGDAGVRRMPPPTGQKSIRKANSPKYATVALPLATTPGPALNRAVGRMARSITNLCVTPTVQLGAMSTSCCY